MAAKYSYTMLDPVLMVQFRLLIATLIVLPLFVKNRQKVPKPQWKMLWLLAFLNYTAIFLLQFIGLKYTTASSAVTMIGLEPLFVVFVGHIFFNDQAQWFHWLCGIMAFFGIVMLMSSSNESGGADQVTLLGCLLALGASLLFAVILRWTQRMIATIGSAVYTSVSIVLGMLTTLPFTLLLTEDWHIHFNWLGLFGLLYLGVGCSWFAYWLWNKGLDKVDANISGILTSLEPIFGVLLAIILLGEHLSLNAILGILIIISATMASALLPKISGKKQA